VPQAGEVHLRGEPVPVRIEQAEQEVRGERDGHPVPVDQPQEVERVVEDDRRRHVHLRRPGEDGQQMAFQERGDVVEADPVERDVRGPQPVDPVLGGHRHQEVAVGEHHGLGPAGRSGGRHQDGDIVRAGVVRADRRLVAGQFLEGGDPDVRQEEPLTGHEQGPVQKFVQVPVLVPVGVLGARRERTGHEAAEHARPEGRKERSGVVQQHQHVVVRAQTLPAQAGQHAECLVQQFRVAAAPRTGFAAVVQRGSRVGPRRVCQQPTDVRHLHDFPSPPGRRARAGLRPVPR
jgi:hypothetical protein